MVEIAVEVEQKPRRGRLLPNDELVDYEWIMHRTASRKTDKGRKLSRF